MSCCVVEVPHVLRERNKLKDHLANLTLENNVIIQAASFGELGTHGRRILNSDKLQVPYIRVKKAKQNHMNW